jgi:hypothetical protein
VNRTLKTALALAMILAASAAVALAGYFVYKSRRDQIVRDEHLCPINSPVKGHVVIAVDWTDRFTSQQRDALKDIITRYRREIAVDERLSLNLITGDPEDAGTPIFSYCKPLDPDNINPLIENERRLRDKWNEQFGKPLDDALAKLLQGSKASKSPILEAIDVILWSHTFQGDLPRRELVLFSDLLQNTPPGQNHYKQVPSPCAVALLPVGQRLKAKNWHNLRVVLYYWRNPDPQAANIQGPHHLSFWTHLFYLLDASEVWDGSRKVPGDQAECVTERSPSTPPPRPKRPLRRAPANSKKPNEPPPIRPLHWPFGGLAGTR